MTASFGAILETVDDEVRVDSEEDVYVFPCSVAQRRYWLLDQLRPGDTSLNMPIASRLTGVLDVPALERALHEIVRRHESLRTTFGIEEE